MKPTKENESRQLERLAADAHRAGVGWSAFWPTVAHRMNQAEPDAGVRRRLVNRLLALVASGDCEGMEPAATRWGCGEGRTHTTHREGRVCWTYRRRTGRTDATAATW